MAENSFSPTRRLMTSSSPAFVSKNHLPLSRTSGMGVGQLSLPMVTVYWESPAFWSSADSPTAAANSLRSLASAAETRACKAPSAEEKVRGEDDWARVDGTMTDRLTLRKTATVNTAANANLDLMPIIC